MRAICLCFVVISLPNAVFAISCLVMRPGYGFTSEACPSAAVGCRIKARSDHVEWYEWSKLYDRNQLVCVYPGEYDGLAGCVRKHSGNIRCWCGGTDDCNTPEMSRQLIDAFQGSDRTKMEIIMRNLEMGMNQGEEVKVETTTTERTTTSTTARTRPTRPPPKKVTHKKPHQKATKMAVKTPKTTKMTPSSTTTTSTTSTTSTVIPTTMKTVTKAIRNQIEDGKAFPLPADTFDETRRRLNEEMKQEDERLQQLLADEEAEMISDNDETREEREEQRRIDRERNRMERRERARADERRRLTEEETLRNNERSQKHRETLPSTEEMDEYDYSDSSSATTISFLPLILSLSLVLLR